MTLAGASPGGAWSAIGEVITDELRRAIPGSTFTLEPGQDGANAALVQSGRVELGLVHSSIARAAIAGSFPFRSVQPDIRAVMLVYGDAPFHFIVDRRTGIDSFEDISGGGRLGLRISVNTAGSLMELATRTTLEAYGINYEDIRGAGGYVLFYPVNTSFEMMQRARVNVIGVTMQIPSTQAIAASRLVNLDILSLSPEAVAFANERLGTEPATITRETYAFLDHDVHTFAGRVILVTSRSVPDDTIYLVTRTLHDRLAQLRRAHGSLKALTAETMPQVGGVPLHSGAERFYREIGAL
jgi:TRAP transporter TAXI family solute receptor